MSFVSYAQNREDVLLWRALGHIKNGFYIDVGANEPQHDSVTQAFYQRGWWGINIEPVPGLHRLLCEQRPRDINLAIAAGAADAEITLFDLPDVNGWATANPDVAAAHRADGHRVLETQVPVRTLNAVCAEHVRGDIHFLKIDVEGFEGEVLRGIDLARWRPWIVVVEATMPNSRATNHEQWEALLTGQHYRYCWFDGLNRYYVAHEQAALMAALTTPPNVFDDYIPAQLDQAWRQLTDMSARQEAALERLELARTDAEACAQQHAAALAAQAASTHAQLAALVASAVTAIEASGAALQHGAAMEARALQAEHEAARLHAAYAAIELALTQANEATTVAGAWGVSLEAKLDAMYHSSSWRVTAPLRRAGELRRAASPRAVLRRLALWAMARPRLRTLALRLMRRWPALAALVRGQVATLVHPPSASRVAQDVPPDHLVDVPVSARKVLHDLARERSSLSAGNP